MRLIFAHLVLACLLVVSASVLAATPPPQPKEGPGGSNYVASAVTKRAVGRASAATYVFHSEGAASEPRPVVVFLHAWGSVNPQVYGGWIDHLARKGFLVLVPRFQEIGRTRPVDASGRAATLVKEALEALASDPQARPDLDRVAFAGHLAGAPMAVNLAALAKAEGLPVPKLVFAVMPGGIAQDAKSRGIVLADLGQIDPATLLITMTGDRDHLAADRAAKRLLKEAENIPATRKMFMRALSDDHGFPTLSATLFSPGSVKEGYDAASIKLPPDPPRDPKQKPEPRPKWSPDMVLSGEQSVLVAQLSSAAIDSLDYLAFWKTFDMAASAAFAGKDAGALRSDPRFTDMERWSDGWPVKRLVAEAPRADAPATGRTPLAPSKATVTGRRR